MPATSYVNDLVSTKAQRDVLDILNAPGILGRPFIVAKDVPRERVRILADALAASLQDDALLAEAQKQSLPIGLFAAEEAETVIRTIYSASPDLIRKVKDVYD
jgi:hypothetical protein